MKNKFANYTTSLLLLCSLLTNNLFSQISPTIEWQKLSWGDEDVLDNPQTQSDSGEDWWYSHKNVYSTKDLINGIYLLSFIKNSEAPVYYKLVNIKE